uniref:Serine-threonine/tyrosine-protein kinase catalytic domain-containing protein n=1 Tax=Anguilla anguilla TaxID=7936 RepID=A0A0E9V6P7_ANGAN
MTCFTFLMILKIALLRLCQILIGNHKNIISILWFYGLKTNAHV